MDSDADGTGSGTAIAVVEELQRRFASGDGAGIAEVLHPDFTIEQPRSLPHGGRHAGIKGMVELAARFAEHWDRSIAEPQLLALSFLVGLVLVGCGGGAPSPTTTHDRGAQSSLETTAASPAAGAEWPDEISAELVEMARVDQEERSHFGDPDAMPWHDEERTARLRDIVDQYGWPSPDRVDTEVMMAAWLIAQHSDADPDFQQLALSLLSETPD